MKNNFFRAISLLLVLLMLMGTLLACKKDVGDSSNESGGDGEGQGSVSTEKIPASAIEATGLELKNFGGKTFRMWYSTNGSWAPRPLMVEEKDAIGPNADIISKAGYERNVAMEQTFGVEMDYVTANTLQVGTGATSSLVALRNLYNSGDTSTFDIIFTGSRTCATLALEGFYYDLAKCENIQPEKYYYENQVNEGVKIHGQRFFAAGYYSTQNTAAISCSFVNLSIIDDLTQGQENEQTLYQRALDKKWTLEYALELGKAYATPTENTGVLDEGKYSFLCLDSYIYPLYYDMGGKYLEYNQNTGKYDCVVQEHKNQDILTYLQSRIGANIGTIVGLSTAGSTPGYFKKQVAPIMYGDFLYLSMLNDATMSWTVMPTFLYNEGDDYISFSIGHNTNFAGIPAACSDLDKASYLYEMFMAISYDIVYPAYYEKCYQVKYQPNSSSAQVFDLMAKSRAVCLVDMFQMAPDFRNVIGEAMLPVGSTTATYNDSVEAFLSKIGW